MTSKQAAAIIGCTVAHVRLLVRTGKLSGRRRYSEIGVVYYDLDRRDVVRYAQTPQGVGFPRGRKRS